MNCPICGMKAHKAMKRYGKKGLTQVYRCTNIDPEDKHQRHFTVPIKKK